MKGEKRKYGHGALSLGGLRVECNITHRCNAQCTHCNKAVSYADGILHDMTVEQIRKAVDQLLEQEIKVTRWTFCGGEPVLHTGLQDMVYEVDRLPTLHVGRILTNGQPEMKKRRESIHLPKRFKWVVNPLDDPNDPYSGKDDRSKRKKTQVHQPFWISPADIGQEANFENCTVRGWCGIGLDAEGWSVCGKAVMLGKLLGMNVEEDVAKWDTDIVEHIDTPRNEICKHCQYGILGKKKKQEIQQKYIDGEYENVGEDGISPTFKEAFARYNGQEELVQLEGAS